MLQTVVMVTTSYPRFPGDTIGTFMEPIAQGVAARGHRVHVVAPWHPALKRAEQEHGVTFHFYRYAPIKSLNVFGYAGALREDVRVRLSAYLAAPLALVAGTRAARRVAREVGATVIHGHWVIPGGAMAAAAARGIPLVVSLHGSDVYLAERHALVGRVARATFQRAAWVTACSVDLRQRALGLGANRDITEVVPYGVDAERFHPSEQQRRHIRQTYGIDDTTPLLFAAGRFVRKKGFEYLIDAVADLIADWPTLILVLGGGGDMEAELKERARLRHVTEHVRFPGVLSQNDVAALLSAADVAIVPSVRDDAGNIDGLPNVVMEALASGTPLVTTTAGGIGAVTEHGRTALHVPQRDGAALARAIGDLLADPASRKRIGQAARHETLTHHGWAGVAERFERAYDRATASTSAKATADKRP